MSGFDLPPITGFDIGSLRNPLEGAMQSPEGMQGLQGPEVPVRGIERAFVPGGDTSKPFSGVLADSLDQVRSLQLDVKEKVRGFVLGEGVELHDVMIAGSKSEVAFNLLLEVRNKMVAAWEKLSRAGG